MIVRALRYEIGFSLFSRMRCNSLFFRPSWKYLGCFHKYAINAIPAMILSNTIILNADEEANRQDQSHWGGGGGKWNATAENIIGYCRKL
jgi:hypothetical protein